MSPTRSVEFKFFPRLHAPKLGLKSFLIFPLRIRRSNLPRAIRHARIYLPWLLLSFEVDILITCTTASGKKIESRKCRLTAGDSLNFEIQTSFLNQIID